MSATETFRAMLEERGVEYTERNMFCMHVFQWGAPPHDAMFTDAGGWTELVVENATPEQAIAATLGHSPNCTNSERTSNELLPCPFCGGEAEIVHTPKVIPYEPWWIRCSLCEVTTPKYKSETAKADAIAAWNRRAES